MSASLATRRIVATVLTAGALVGAAALPAVADDHRSHHSSIVLGEVHWDNHSHDNRTRNGARTEDNRTLNGEWVEVRNTSRRSVDLRGFTLTDQEGNRYRFDLRLDGHSSVKVHTGHGRDTHRDVYQNRNQQIWDAHDTATLRDDRHHVIDTETWGRGHHHH